MEVSTDCDPKTAKIVVMKRLRSFYDTIIWGYLKSIWDCYTPRLMAGETYKSSMISEYDSLMSITDVDSRPNEQKCIAINDNLNY